MSTITVGGGDIGNFEWTMPANVQEALDMMPEQNAATMQEWMAKMLEAYMVAVMNAALHPNQMPQLTQQTINIMMQAGLSRIEGLVVAPPGTSIQ